MFIIVGETSKLLKKSSLVLSVIWFSVESFGRIFKKVLTVVFFFLARLYFLIYLKWTQMKLVTLKKKEKTEEW